MTGSSTFVSADGDGYELQMGRWSRRRAPLFIDFVGIERAERVLDVGCGTGSLSAGLAQIASIRSVRGVDVSSVYIDYATRTNHDARLAFQVADACALPFADASFDHALSLLVLPLIPEPAWDTRGGFVAYRLFFDTAAMLTEAANARRADAYTRSLSRPGELARSLTSMLHHVPGR